ncbi:MAG: pitrilysin family protein [Bdellovibrionales bacterium]
MLFLLAIPAPAHATVIQEVTSRGGIKAWLVEDHKLPLVSMRFAFKGGIEQDPADKQGLAHLTTELLTQGAGPYDAQTFQQALADRSISLGFGAGRDEISGSLKALSADKDKAFEMLALALTKPRFAPREIEQLRAQQLSSIRAQFSSPDWQARFVLLKHIFEGHPYAMRRLGSLESVSGLRRDDVVRFASDHFAREGLVVAVAGDMTPQELSVALDKVFGALPRNARNAAIREVAWPQDTPVILVQRSGTQTNLMFAMPGPKRDDPDWHAAEIANYILGGGGFSSRLMKDVRSDKGLTYGIHTGLAAMEHGGMIMGDAATDNARTGEAWGVIRATLRRFYEDGVSAKEIAAAKDYLTGSMPLALTSTDKISGVLVDIQRENLGIDYLDRRNDLIRSVTQEDVERVIRKWFDPDKITLSLAGKPEGIMPTRTEQMVRE